MMQAWWQRTKGTTAGIGGDVLQFRWCCLEAALEPAPELEPGLSHGPSDGDPTTGGRLAGAGLLVLLGFGFVAGLGPFGTGAGRRAAETGVGERRTTTGAGLAGDEEIRR